MKFIEKSASAGPNAPRSGASVHSRPDWLKDWIANKGQYVKLTCGHRVDLNERTVLIDITKVDGAKKVWCYMHEDVYDIEKSIGVFEMHYGFPPPPIPDEPMF